MFVGHLAVALAARKKAPNTSLAWLVAATQLLDLLWPIFLVLGVERVSVAPGNTPFTPLAFDSYPWSHSLEGAFVWGFLLYLLAAKLKVPKREALLLWPLVLSHWVLDVITHLPDMPLWVDGGPHLGLGLWRSVPATLIVEGAMWIAAIVLYLRARPLRGGSSQVGFWSFIAITTVTWVVGAFAPPPPSATMVAWTSLVAVWLLVPWAWWADRRPSPLPSSTS